MAQRVLITGGSGLLALNWALTIRDSFCVTLGFHKKVFPLKNVKHQRIDIENYDNFIKEVKLLKPDIIIHTAGLTNVEYCERSADLAKKVNVDLSLNIARACKELNIFLVHISTDHLFSNNKSYLDEEDKICPINVYGYTKADAETKVIKNCPKALIIRTNFFGWGPIHRFSFSDRILGAISFNRPISLFKDVFFTPILIEELVNIVHKLIKVKASGIFNVSGSQRISKYDFGIKLVKKFNYNYKLIKPDFLKNNSKLVRRPLNMSLSNKKSIELLKKEYGDIDSNISKLYEQKEDGLINELKPYTPYGKHHLDDNDINSVTKLLKSGNPLTQGPIVNQFEEMIADYVGAKYAVAVSSCSAGLHIGARAAGLGPGNTMITSSITFVSSANAALHNNANVNFTDIDEENINMSISSLKNKIDEDSNISLVMPVHFAGFPCDMKSINEISNKKGLKIIEDAAHALGSTYSDGRRVGCCSHSLMTVFSFHPVKTIASGEGGMITTNDEEIYRRLLRLRSHGINKLDDKHINLDYSKNGNIQNPWYYEMQELGFNFRITDIQCTLGISQLKKIDKFLSRRRKLVNKYDEAFKDLKNIKPIQPQKKYFSGHHLYILRISYENIGMTKAELMNNLKSVGIGTQVHYIPLPIHPYFKKLGFNASDFPNAMKYYDEALSIPLFYDLTDEQQNYIIDIFKNYIA